jgi:bifunctional UDP-N-acetylglucosamine pyrophosphorylase/glucosamine-1-phosphate N-acetyltransferase
MTIEKKTEKKTEKSRSATAIILAAGKGTRMCSPLPKVLHPVCGKPMIEKVITACRSAGIDDIRIIVGHGGNLVRAVVEPLGVQIFSQAQQLGTGDAVKAAQIESLQGDVIVLNGDHPLIEEQDIRHFLKVFREEKLELAVVTCIKKNPGDFGRIIRHQGTLRAIVEAKDASADTLKVKEVNTGIYVAQAEILQDYLPRIQNNNSKGEFYLTDIVSLTVDEQCRVMPILSNPSVAFGVNTQAELARANTLIFKRKAKQLLDSGVLMLDPRNTYIEPTVEVLPGAVIHPQVYLRGKTKIGSFTSIEPNCYILDSEVGESVLIRANSYIEGTRISSRASIGPFARLRPDTEIGEEAHVGNFVEMKKVKFGAKSKAGHLTYLGDAEVGVDTNIGCGTITCNYAVDRKKYKTKIGSGVFVGSDSQFVAPVTIGDHAVIASGSTIVKDVPARALGIARGHQHNKENYVAEAPVEPSEHENPLSNLIKK